MKRFGFVLFLGTVILIISFLVGFTLGETFGWDPTTVRYYFYIVNTAFLLGLIYDERKR